MREARRGGGLSGLVALLVLVMLAGLWFAGGRQAWNRWRLRGELRGALEAYQAGREDEGDRLAERAKRRTNLSALPPGPERDLYHSLRAVWVRRAYEEQLKRERQDGLGPPGPPERPR